MDAILERLEPVGPGDLIPLLQQIQDEYGYLPPDVLEDVSRRTGIPTSRMFGVITFYAQFSLTPPPRMNRSGQNRMRIRSRNSLTRPAHCCQSSCCSVRARPAVRPSCCG